MHAKNYVAVLSKDNFRKSINEHRTRIRKSKEQFLLELPLFQKFRKRIIAEEFVDNMKSKVFKRGDFIIRENETATDMIFIILHGWVKITRT